MNPPIIRANPVSPPQSVEIKRTTPSVFDLLADDEPNGNSDGSTAQEAHVAFSVEGLGKVGAETPPYSPRQPGRYDNYGYASPLKAARQITSSKNLDYVLDDLEVEVASALLNVPPSEDAIMQNVDMPRRGHPLEFSLEMEDSYCKLKNNLSTVTDNMQLDGHGRMKSSFGDRKTFGKTESINDDTWDENIALAEGQSKPTVFLVKRTLPNSREGQKYILSFNIILDMGPCSILNFVLMVFMFNADFWDETEVEDLFQLLSWDASFHDGRESDMSWNSWPYPMDGNSADFLKYGNDRLPDDAFEGSHLLKKRNSMNAKEAFNILDSPSLKHQTSETDFDFMISERARKPSLRTNFGFGDTTVRPDWSCFTAEDARDNQSLLSEESSSSTAVRGKETDVSPSNSRARRSRRHQNAFGFPQKNSSAKNIFLKGRRFKNGEEIQKGNSVFGSGKSMRQPMLSESRSAHNLDCPFQEKIGSSRSWLFKEGYGSAEMNMGFSSPCRTSETKHPFSSSKPWPEDTFGVFPEPQIDAKFSFETSKHGGSIKHSPSSSFISEKFAFCQQSSRTHVHDSPTFSKVEFRVTKPDFALDYPDFELEINSPDASDDAASHGEKLVLELSAKESVRKDKKNRSKFQQTNYEKVKTWNSPVGKNMKPVDALESEDNGLYCMDAKDVPLETSSSVKIPIKSEGSVDKKEYHHDAEVSPRPNGNEEGTKGVSCTDTLKKVSSFAPKNGYSIKHVR
ncbi:unnamed protein product [Dovyalis caffra]|uniref:Uncharacterized protein n=1 Tax=Dovyalis caffra TaxID=77055 RepID=A0AAV1QP34_9ROSI|nr:unnamed protein product [Dovyalis caffra]